jgi:2-polyprenyl-3-methyl-5-hydroxy-6-metoxy-1,4-benzoquinol methylase
LIFGNGNYSAYLAEKAVSVLAFDYSEKMVELAKSAKNGMLITLSFV